MLQKKKKCVHTMILDVIMNSCVKTSPMSCSANKWINNPLLEFSLLPSAIISEIQFFSNFYPFFFLLFFLLESGLYCVKLWKVRFSHAQVANFITNITFSVRLCNRKICINDHKQNKIVCSAYSF